jgi:hypothetical protein
MRVRHIRQWKYQSWTRLYEAALLEQDAVKLCTCIWRAQSAILQRQHEVKRRPRFDSHEKLALRKAQAVLHDLGRMSGIPNLAPRVVARQQASKRWKSRIAFNRHESRSS